MPPFLRQLFYTRRPLVLALACASPVPLLAGLWLLVSAVVLVPAVPGDDATPQECIEFVVHEKGLPRLSPAERAAFIEARVQQLLQDQTFRDRFAAALRRSAADDKAAFRRHVFDALKLRVLGDAREFQELGEGARSAWPDKRLVDYKRLEMLLRTIQIDKGAFGDVLPDGSTLVELILSRTTGQQRELCRACLDALARRANQILQAPELRRQFEQRLGFAIP